MPSTFDYMLMQIRADQELARQRYHKMMREIEHGFEDLPYKCKFCQAEGKGFFKREDSKINVNAIGDCPSCGRKLKWRVRLRSEEPL